MQEFCKKTPAIGLVFWRLFRSGEAGKIGTIVLFQMQLHQTAGMELNQPGHIRRNLVGNNHLAKLSVLQGGLGERNRIRAGWFDKETGSYRPRYSSFKTSAIASGDSWHPPESHSLMMAFKPFLKNSI